MSRDINHYFWQKYQSKPPLDFGPPYTQDSHRFYIDEVTRRLNRIKPHPVLLSGGLDSSMVAAVTSRKVKKLEAFTLSVGSASYNEYAYAQLVADHLGLRHISWGLPDNVDDLIEEVIGPEPFGDSSLIPLYYLLKKASNYTDIVNTGDGGDEIFGGYDTYKAYQIAKWIPEFVVNILRMLPVKPSGKKVTLSFKIQRFCRDYNSEIGLRHLRWMGTFGEAERKKLLGDRFIPDAKLVPAYGDTLAHMQRCDLERYLPGCCMEKSRLAGQAAGIKVEAPLLDLAPIVQALPQRYKVRGLTTKWLLKRIARHYLPRKIINRAKRGFTAPVSKWIRRSDLIRDNLVMCDAKLNRRYVMDLLAEHDLSKADHSRKLWLIFVWNYSREKRQNENRTTNSHCRSSDWLPLPAI